MIRCCSSYSQVKDSAQAAGSGVAPVPFNAFGTIPAAKARPPIHGPQEMRALGWGKPTTASSWADAGADDPPGAPPAKTKTAINPPQLTA